MIHFETTRPRGDRCPRCGRLRLTGLAEGIPYRVEPAPLNARAELLARVGGRVSYAICGGMLVWRTPERIRGDFRGRPIVFADHRCAQPAEAADIDTRFLPAVAGFLAKLGDAGRFTDVEIDALTMLACQLGARVVATDTPPY